MFINQNALGKSVLSLYSRRPMSTIRRDFVTLFLLVFICAATSIVRAEPAKIIGSAGSVLWSEEYAEFNEPWAMTFLPDGDMLVTEKAGKLLLVSGDGRSRVPVAGVPKVAYGGQGGLGDVIVRPEYASTWLVFADVVYMDGAGNKGPGFCATGLR